MEGQKKKHFPSIQRNLESTTHRQSDVIKSLLRLKGSPDQEGSGLGTTSDFNHNGSAKELNFGSSQIRFRHLKKKKSDVTGSVAADGSSNMMTSTTMSSISKITLEEESTIQQIEQLMSHQTIKLAMQDNGIGEEQARCVVFDGIFIGKLIRTVGNSHLTNRYQVLVAMICQRLKQYCDIQAARASCQDKQNRINSLIENRLKKLVASLP